MIKSELVQRISAQNPHLYQRDVENIVNAILGEIIAAMARGDRVELRGFGAFSVKQRPARTGRNPRTGAHVVGRSEMRAVLQDRQGNARAAQSPGRSLTASRVAERPEVQKVLRKIVAALILVPLAIVIIAFAVANRQLVTVSLDPFSADQPAASLTLPLFALIIVLLILGVVIGGIAAWLRQSKWRRTARRLEREVAELARRNQCAQAHAGGAAIIPDQADRPQRLKLRPPVR